MVIGVLSLQGDFAEHMQVLEDLRVSAREVRTTDDLAMVDRLIIPGGESTVMAKLLWKGGLGDMITKRARANELAIYGTCAGAILLAKTATGKNAPATLGLMDITIERNAYGTQIESFETELLVKGRTAALPVAFIRAPVITTIGKGVDVLAEHEGRPVLVRQGRLLAGTFHPEVRGETAIHKLFLQL